MKNVFKIIALLLLCLGTLVNCRQKKVFKHVEIKGRLIRKSTQGPADMVEMHLTADNKYLSKDYYDGSVELVSMTTGSDGTFTLKSRASRTNTYYIKVRFPTGQQSEILDGTSVKENEVTDLGDVLLNF